jgi:hypothetical protein
MSKLKGVLYMKKFLSTVFLVAAVSAVSLTSFAADESPATAEKAERKAFKASISQQISAVKDARSELKAQRDQNKALASEIKAALKADKKSENPVISEETRAQIALIFEEIKGVRADIKETKVDMEAARNAKKEAITALDEEGATSTCETLVNLLEGKLQMRADILEALNEIDALIS